MTVPLERDLPRTAAFRLREEIACTSWLSKKKNTDDHFITENHTVANK